MNTRDVIIIILAIWFCYKLIDAKKSESLFFKIMKFSLLGLHILSTWLFYALTNEKQLDAYLFYTNSIEIKNITLGSFLGSDLMAIILYPFSFLGLSFLSCTVIFSCLGFFVFLKYLKLCINILAPIKGRLVLPICFLFFYPSMHYWTSGFTKEVLIFFLMYRVLEFVKVKQFNSFSLYIFLFLIFLLRPYMWLIIGVVLFTLLFFFMDLSHYKKRTIVLVGSFFFIVSIPVLMFFLKIKSLEFNSFKNYYNYLIEYSKTNGNSSIDLESSNYISRFFVVLFRPLFYDSKNIFYTIISIENTITMFLIFSLFYLRIKAPIKQNIFSLYLTLVVIFTVLFYSLYMYNLGLASRMRIMYLPYFLTFFVFNYKGWFCKD